MKTIIQLILLTFICSCNGQKDAKYQNVPDVSQKTDADWKKEMSPFQYYVMRENGTEPAFSGNYYDYFEKGKYVCAACNNTLFDSENKYDSNCGWPSFDQAIKGSVIYRKDISHNMVRTEVRCAGCNSHLGHVFEDGPKDTTGERYCMNSVAIQFIPKEKK